MGALIFSGECDGDGEDGGVLDIVGVNAILSGWGAREFLS